MAKQAIINISSSSQEDSDSFLGQEEEEEEEEEEESDENYNSTSEDERNEDDDDKGCDRREGKMAEEDRCDKVINLLHQRNKKLDVLKLEECKAYLRKHELMISGTKATCIQRILEHWRLKDGNSERLYPNSSFNINCTGDVCKGDVVKFMQTVYENFSKVSRNGEVIGKRTIVGRVVKESYGSAKQQHTFTVEVLWSKGVKPLPLLYPLLVKGRNLYKYRTFRQSWSNEAERSKVLEEKHRRGATARNVRASTKARISEGSKRQRALSDSKQQQIKRPKKHSEAPTSRKIQQKTSNKHAESSFSANHSNKLKTNTSSNTNMPQIHQSESAAKPLHFSTHRPNFQNIYGPDFHQMNNVSALQAGRERFLIPVYSHSSHTYSNSIYHNELRSSGHFFTPNVHASQFDQRSHLSHTYSNYVSQNDSRSSGHFFIPDIYDQRYANLQFHGRSKPWPY